MGYYLDEQRIQTKEALMRLIPDEKVRQEVWSFVDDLISEERSEEYDRGYNDGMAAERQIHCE